MEQEPPPPGGVRKTRGTQSAGWAKRLLADELPPRARPYVRRLVGLFMLLAVTAVAFTAAKALKSESAAEVWSVWLFLGFLAAISIHLLYWIVFLLDEINDRPPALVQPTRVLFAFLLTFGYLLAAFQAKGSSLAAFTVAYVMISLMEWKELRHHARDGPDEELTPLTNVTHRVWLGIDGLIALVLLMLAAEAILVRFVPQAIWETPPAGAEPLAAESFKVFFTVKDLIILVNLIGYGFARFAQSGMREASRVAYRRLYLRQLETVEDPNCPRVDLRKLIEATDGLNFGFDHPFVVDIPCGNGERTTALAAAFGLDCTRHGCDRNPTWRWRYERSDEPKPQFHEAHVRSLDDLKKGLGNAWPGEDLSRPIVLITGHALHTREFANEIRVVIEELRDRHLVVIVAGPSPDHHSTHLMNEVAVRGLRTEGFHRWFGDHLRLALGLPKRQELEPQPRPCFTIRRVLGLSLRTARYYAWWAETMFGRPIGSRLYRNLTKAARDGKTRTLNFDDHVYCFARAAADPDRDPALLWHMLVSTGCDAGEGPGERPAGAGDPAPAAPWCFLPVVSLVPVEGHPGAVDPGKRWLTRVLETFRS